MRSTTSPRLSTPARAPAKAEPAARREYRERDFGIGYGRSSGYASTRQYATRWNGQPLFRCI
ncbi:MAG: hypothetical protein ACJ8GK_04175 [Luteimonas sp.]